MHTKVLSNRHKMSDLEDLGPDDDEVLTVACASELAVPDIACGEPSLSE